jgi:phosphoglycerate kinase
VLLRVDFNVPLFRSDGPGGDVEIEDDFRVRAALPTIDWLTTRGAVVSACTHLGRPHGPDPRFAVTPVRQLLTKIAPGVSLLENLRFDPGEERNDPAFVTRLVDDFDYYVNDAFGASHRTHASIVGPPARLPSAAGRLVQREVEVLGGLLTTSRRPFVAVVGGAKVADKLGVLSALLRRVDRLILGGGMAFTFLLAQGRSVGSSLVDLNRVEECRRLLRSAGDRLLLPVDVLALEPGGVPGPGRTGSGEVRHFDTDIPDGWQALDIGPRTAEIFTQAIQASGTIFWNGPMGVFEDARFSAGTRGVANAVAGCDGFTVVGGGDSAAAIDELGLASRVDFMSTGGGAALELLEYGDLPGLEALRGAPNAPGRSRA